MRLFKCFVFRELPLKPKYGTVFQSVILMISFFLIADTNASSSPDTRESHLLATRRSGEQKEKSQVQVSPRAARSHSLVDRKRSERIEKQVFRLELLRQIKAIDHMKCFPKVLCGLSVDSDKSFGINKSNFVRSYLELMRNIKRPGPVLGGGFADDRLRPEEEIEKELIWPFSPHNPDRKHHSSFERISSAAMSASVELADSPEYLSRRLGVDSRNIDGSMSMEKIDRMGVVADSVESKEEEKSPPVVSATMDRMENSKIPGEKKNKKNANKSLTAKITSYFTSWLPELPTFTWGKSERSSETGTENEKWAGRNIDDLRPSPELLSNLEDIVDYLMTAPAPEKKSTTQEERKGRADDGAADGTVSRDDFDDGHVHDHDTDIYHTAVNIGKRLKDPKQCDYIYNGCPLEYDRILDMISSLKTEIQPLEDTAEIVSQELGLGVDIPMQSTTTTTTTTTTTKKPQRKKPRPSTKIMHVLPNGEKVEINFRLGGSEDSEESSSSAQRDYIGKKENFEDEPSSEKNKSSDEVVVVDLGQRGAPTSTEEVISSEKKVLTNRKGSPVDAAIIKNKLSSSAKKKLGFHPPKKTTASEDTQEKSDESYLVERAEPHEIIPSHQHNNLRQNPTLKLSGLTLTTNNNEDQPLEISPSYVIIKHQPLSVHTTSVLSPDNLQQSQQHPGLLAHEKLQTFQLVQNGQKLDADQITDQLKNYIRQSGGIIPKLSLHSSGLITTDTSDSLPYGSYSIDQQNIHPPNSNPYAGFKFEPSALASALNKLASSTQAPSSTQQPQQQQQPLSIAHLPYAAYYSLYNNGPEMVGSVPGRLDSLIKPKTTTTTTSTTTSTTSTTTEKIILPGMQETLTLDTDEITEDTMKKLESDNSVPGWISKTSDQTSAESKESESEEDDEQAILENLNKTLMKDNNKASKIKYKNPEKRRTRVKANSSRVRASLNRDKKNKDGKRKGSSSTRYTSGSEETSAERVVIKHAGPYVYKSPLKGPGPHGGAFPYPMHGMQPSVFPGMPFWRM